MIKSRKRVAAGLGAAVIAGTAGLVAVAPAASAGTVTVQADCNVPIIGPKQGPQNVTVDLTPVAGPAGITVTANVDLGPPPITSPLAIANAKAQSTLHLTMSGAATGVVDLAGPEVTLDLVPNVPIDPAPFTTTFTIPANASVGDISFTPTGTTNITDIPGFGQQIAPCTYTGGGAVATFTVEAPPAPVTATVAPTTIQQGSGGTVTGTGWEGTISGVEMCVGAACQPYPVHTIAVGANGALTGGFTVVDQVPPGTYSLKITSDSGQSTQTNTFTVTGVPPVTAAVNPTSGDLGAATTVTGTNWPAGNVTVQGLKQDNTPTTDAPVTVAVAADGTFTTPYTVNDANTRKIGVTNGTKSAAAAYTVKVGQQVSQDLEGEVIGGGLNFQQAGTGISLTPITLNGKPQTMNGALNQVKVQDFRGTTLGWDLTGQITDFTSPAVSGVISADRFTWTPVCAVTNPDSPSAVQTGSAGAVGALCIQSPNAPGQVSGGEFTADAATKLSVPAWQLSGTYTATLTLTLI
ncbi:hypothetical protein [Yinghuangia sp. YIM S09857]|uniref:hypothetical protein n=1 Tax=Yinghuangia sp. YIM S09857 TaxID=3436929 RepID=UPI003F5307C1